MPHARSTRGRVLLGRLLTVPLAAALLAGCEPNAPGGYDKVVHREKEALPPPAFPDPPAPDPSLLAGGGGEQAQVVAASLPQGVTQEMVDQGQQLFNGGVCTACHGSGGVGGALAPALNDAEWLNISGDYPEIVTTITTGVPSPKQFPGAMPPKGGGSFTDEQVRQLAAYVYALSHQEGA